jgi:glycosidase
MANKILVFGLSFIVLMACQSPNHEDANKYLSDSVFKQTPTWAKEVVWYQLFVERFRNGDTTNDPTPWDIFGAYPDQIPRNWKTTPWTQDWYKPDPWFDETGMDKFQDNLQLRRYGGDLQGVLDKLDYLQDLGITAIYFNPLNDAPSLHKYDPRSWRHIDRNFGPNPRHDEAIIAAENPIDPATWKYTSADSLFLKVIDACHKKGMHVILDYSWNHTGMDFWALNDIRKKGETSEFKDWYNISQYDNLQTPEDEFTYKGWYDIKYLAEIKKDIVGQDSVFPFKGNLYSAQAKMHIFNVARRWLDPNNDGNPADGIDGYRLNVAAEIPLGFWPEFRREVRKINPEAYLIGEIWWQKWPDDLMNPAQFLKGDMFDAVMNYRWYRSARQFFAQAEPAIGSQAFADSLMQLNENIHTNNQRAMMNLTASHDAPRMATSMYNKGKYKYMAKPYDDARYKTGKPDAETRARQLMLLVHQYTYIGAPHIWYGDEVGMWGADDPDTRKPMVWNDLEYEPESHHPLGKKMPIEVVKPDTLLYNYIKSLIQLRKNNPALINGDFQLLKADNTTGLFCYKRDLPENKVWVLINNSKSSQTIMLNLPRSVLSEWTPLGMKPIEANNRILKVTIEPLHASIFCINDEYK